MAESKTFVPRFILPDYMIRRHLKEIESQIAAGHQDKVHLDALRIEYKEHLEFQEAIRRSHCTSGGSVSALAIAHHGPEVAAGHAHDGGVDKKVIPEQIDDVIGNMMNAVDRDYGFERGDKLMELPGKIVKADFDATAKHVYDNAMAVYQYYREVHNRDSLNNHHLKLISSIHYGRQYANAFWTPMDLQMVYGDGNPKFLTHIAEALDVAGHEMTHGVIDQECRLTYRDESGALNESIADVFGMMVKQWKNKLTVAQSDWLIGAGTVPTWGKGLRSFTHEPANRMDIQPKTYKGIEMWKRENSEDVDNDEGGVHLLSGITNYAFYLFCKTFTDAGFTAYNGLPAKVWYGVVVGKKIKSDCNFHEFAALTVDKAKELGGADVAHNLQKVWAEVGIDLAANAAHQAHQAANIQSK